MRFPEFKLLHLFLDNPTAKYNLSYSDMLPTSLKEAGIKIDDANLAETYPGGNPELRKLLAEQHDVKPENILVTASCSEANFDVCAALLNYGDEAISIVPNYPPLFDLPRGLGAMVKRVRLKPDGGFHLDLDALEKAVTRKTRLVIMTNINNPTSAIVGNDHMMRLAEIAQRRDFHVLCDETFRELAFERKPRTAASFGDRMVATNTMSKVYGMGGLRLGWIVASGRALSRILNVIEYNTVTPPSMSEHIALAVLSDKRRFLDRARRIIDRNRKIVDDWLQRNDRVHWTDPGVGNIAFPKVDADVDRLATILLKEYGTVMASGTYFGMKGRFRLGFGRSEDELATGLENFDKALRSIS